MSPLTPHLPSLPAGDVLTASLRSKQGLYDDARRVFKDICMKNLDWPEAMWDAWLAFEQLHGSVEELEHAMDKVEFAQGQTSLRRQKVSGPRAVAHTRSAQQRCLS